MQSPSILIINGPNLNMLGKRDPAMYGTQTLADIESACRKEAGSIGFAIEWFQSNHEGALIDKLHASLSSAQGVIINAGAYTHTSIALLDALSILPCPIIEVHLSNVFAREEFRHHSYISKAAKGVICGFGGQSYILALQAMRKLVQE